MQNAEIVGLTALELRDRIAAGSLTSVTVATAFLDAIDTREPEVQAWAFVDRDFVLAEAEAVDRRRANGDATGPLHGLPIAVKDIIDTAAMPTENGTLIDSGRRPAADAAVVERLAVAEAVILGKAVTTELAAFGPGKTRNPHDPSRTPGGSSSGSAAAVAARMAPLAIGTQTNGSVIRPASFCGVVGFKPTRALISRHGILPQAPSLDTVGVFARNVADAALFTDALAGYDARDPATFRAARPGLLDAALRSPGRPPRLAFVRSPAWDKADADVRDGLAEIVAKLGKAVRPVDLPPAFDDAHRLHRIVNMVELARSYCGYYDRDKERLTPIMQGMVEEGRTLGAVDYLAAVAGIDALNSELETVLAGFDAVITPAAAGEAPVGEATGDPAFSTIWTYCGVPALTLPLLTGSHGMPIGVQIVGRRLEDARLLQVGRWLSDTLAPAPGARRG